MTYFLNRAQGTREANIKWAIHHHASPGQDSLTLLSWVALRAIQPGEELIADYQGDTQVADTSVGGMIEEVGKFFDRDHEHEGARFRPAALKRRQSGMPIFVTESNLCVDERGFSNLNWDSNGEVAWKKNGLMSFGGDLLPELPTDGAEAMQLLAQSLSHVSVEKSNDHHQRKTMQTTSFAAQGRGAVYRATHVELKRVDPAFAQSNWATHVGKNFLQPKLLMAHAPHLTETHTDNAGVWVSVSATR